MLKRFLNFFKTKKVIVVSDNGIVTKNIDNIDRAIKIIIFSWCVFTTLFFLFNYKIQLQKDKKISELKNINVSLNNNITDLTSVVKNVEDYLSALNFYDRFNNIDIKKVTDVHDKLKNNSYLTAEEYKEILPVLDKLERSIDNIEILVNSRINGINNLLKEASLDQKARDLYSVNYKNTEGTTITENNLFKNSVLLKQVGLSELKYNIGYLRFLESFLDSIPVAKPMKNYYLSSKFGSRIDPFTKEVKTHNGLDFAGPYNSYVIAPANGVVAFVGIRGGFGNSLTIKHANGISTDYAHLGKILVKTGDEVKRGDKIGIQGSTGRSTGQHLHLEVRVDNKRVDPGKFLKIGEKIF